MGIIMAKVIIFEDKCKGCKLCISVCPKKILKSDNEKLNKKGFHPIFVTDNNECIGCAFCATICPDCVIEVEMEEK